MLLAKLAVLCGFIPKTNTERRLTSRQFIWEVILGKKVREWGKWDRGKKAFPKGIHDIIPGTCKHHHIFFSFEKVIRDVVKLRILRKVYLGIPRKVLNVITSDLIREAEGYYTPRRKRQLEVEIGGMQTYKLKNASSHQELKEERNQFSHGACGPWFQLSDTDFRFFAFRTVRE